MMDNRINIQLNIIENSDKSEVLFRIIFVNNSDSDVSFNFSNASRKAERLGLNILESGKVIEPVEFEIIKLSEEDVGKRVLTGNARFEYDLVASFSRPGVLKFPGASYLLKPECGYTICFKYQGISSNMVSWEAPAWW
jgi:hypothetical protein